MKTKEERLEEIYQEIKADKKNQNLSYGNMRLDAYEKLSEELNQTNAKLVAENESLHHSIEFIKEVCDGYEKELQAANERIKDLEVAQTNWMRSTKIYKDRIIELEEVLLFYNSELVKLREIIQLKEDAYSDIGNKYSHALLRIKELEARM